MPPALPAEGPPPAAAAAELPVPMPFPLLMDESVRWTRRFLPQIYAPFAMAAAVLAAGSATINQLIQRGMVGLHDPMQVMRAGCSAGLVSLPLALLAQLLGVAMIQAAVEALSGRRPGFGPALRFTARPRVMGTFLLAQVLIWVSFAACLVPVFFVAPLLGLVAPAMAAEGVFGSAALRRSAQLTRYNPPGTLLASPRLKILALYVLVGVVSLVVATLPQLPLVILERGSILRRLAAGEGVQQAMTTWAQVPLQTVGTLLTIPIQIFSSFVLALLFFDLRARREGDDLRRAIAGLTRGLDAGPSLPPPQPPSLPIMLP